MRRGRRPAAWLAILMLLAAAPGGAQSISIVVSGLRKDSMPPGPVVTVSALPGPPNLGPYTITLEMSLDAAFQRPFYANASDEVVTSFTTDSLIPEHELVFLRARLTNGVGAVVAEIHRQHPVMGWVTLVSPPQQSLVVLPTRTPRFSWSSPPTTLTAGLWEYQVEVINTATGAPDFVSPLITDTSYVFPDSLESNASYRWQVRAHARGGRGQTEAVAMSAGTIVIGGEPTVTLLYQNFPNPFRQGQITCFWFDLARAGRVQLTIYDLRLRVVRHIIPGPLGDGELPVGTYGRENIDAQTGCDTRISWDGRDDSGRLVPAGVYLAEFRANGRSTTRKILFLGR